MRLIISPIGEESKLLSILYPIKIKINKEAIRVYEALAAGPAWLTTF